MINEQPIALLWRKVVTVVCRNALIEREREMLWNISTFLRQWHSNLLMIILLQIQVRVIKSLETSK